MGADAIVAEAMAATAVVAGVTMATEAPPGARVGSVTRAKAAAGMAATEAATEEAGKAMEVVDTVVGAQAPPEGSPG